MSREKEDEQVRILLITAAVAALPLLAACGSDDPEPVTAADISQSLQDRGLRDKELADCAAKVYYDEGISQDGLRTLIASDSGQLQSDPQNLGMSAQDADRARTATSKIVTACVGK
ncbi:hypothetical protein ACWEKT_03000 [Nocardia takedensis]